MGGHHVGIIKQKYPEADRVKENFYFNKILVFTLSFTCMEFEVFYNIYQDISPRTTKT